MSKLVNKTAFWFVATIATAFCLKYLHALSETHDLLIILSPANQLLEWFLHTKSKLVDAGFYFPKYDLVINKAFTGGNFFVLAFMVSSLTTPYHRFKPAQASLLFVGVIAFAYVITVLVTTLRTLSIIMLIRIDSFLPWLTSTWFLESMKLIIYAGVLYLMYRLLKAGFTFRSRKFSYTDHYPTF